MKKVNEHHIVHLTSGHNAFDVRIFGRQCKSLAEAGYHVTLIAPHTRDEIIDGIRIRAVPKVKGRTSRMTRTVWRAYREATRQDAKVYHFHDPELIPAGLLLWAARKNVIYDIHEDFPSQILYKQWIPRTIRPSISWLFERLEGFVARRFSAIVSANCNVTERILKLNECVTTIRNFPVLGDFPAHTNVNEARYSSGVVVNFGGIESRTCIGAIVEAMGLLPEKLDVKLIQGGRTVEESLLGEIIQLPGWNRVQYLGGKIAREEMVKQLINASAALVLYTPEPNYFAIASNRLFEAMAAGLPVVTSNFPNWRKLVEGLGCGLTVDPEDPHAITAAITYLLTHPAESAAMGRRGRQAVRERFNWSEEKSKLLKLYDALLNCSGAKALPCNSVSTVNTLEG